MIAGPKPRARRRGKENRDMPVAPDALPRCPKHLTKVAAKEWRRLAKPLYKMGVLSVTDRAALAAYCQAWARWVEAEENLQKGPALIKSPSGHVQQSPWMSIANKQLELMGRYMSELGLSPSARARLQVPGQGPESTGPVTIEFVTVYQDENGNTVREPLRGPGQRPPPEERPKSVTYEIDGDL